MLKSSRPMLLVLPRNFSPFIALTKRRNNIQHKLHGPHGPGELGGGGGVVMVQPEYCCTITNKNVLSCGCNNLPGWIPMGAGAGCEDGPTINGTDS